MNRLTVLFAALIMFCAGLAPLTAHACESSCTGDWPFDLDTTVSKASLVAIVTLKETIVGDGMEGEPDTLRFEVLETLKGTPTTDDDGTILVNSYSGMCPYGIIMDADDRRERLVILRWDDLENEYDAVHECAYKGGPLVDGKVEVGGKEIPKDEIKAALGLE